MKYIIKAKEWFLAQDIKLQIMIGVMAYVIHAMLLLAVFA